MSYLRLPFLGLSITSNLHELEQALKVVTLWPTNLTLQGPQQEGTSKSKEPASLLASHHQTKLRAF